MKSLLPILCILLFACKAHYSSDKSDSILKEKVQSTNQSESNWRFKKIEGSKIVFENGRTIETKLFNLEYIDQIEVVNKDPYFIFSGVDCDNCDANVSIYIHSPSDGQLIVDQGKNKYSYPGKEFDYLTDSLIYECRVFYGQVLPINKGVIWYQRTYLKDKVWENSIFIVDLTGMTKVHRFLDDNDLLQQTLLLYNEGLCKEIEGLNYSSEP
jgi:hypothetical protein